MTAARNYYFQFAAAFIIAFIVIVFQVREYKPDPRMSDSLLYLSVARDFADSGVLTDGTFKKTAIYQGEEGQGMFFAPLYPAMAGLIMKGDPVLYETARCHLESRDFEKCPNDFGKLHNVHILLAILSVIFIWLSAYVVTGNFRTAWIAMILSFFAEAYAYYTAQAMTEILIFPLFTLFCFLGVAAWRYKKSSLWFLCGFFLGLCALTRPSFAYIFYAGIPAMAVWFALNKSFAMKIKLLWLLFIIVGYGVVVAPWMVRNGQAMGQYTITKGYESFTLVQRTSFNAMNWQEWAASFIYGLPDFGDALAVKMFPSDVYERLDYDNPEGFYERGNKVLRAETIEKAGGKENHFSYLVHNEIMNDPFKHVMVTLSLAWRGMWVSKYWGLVAIPLFLGVFIFALRRGWTEFILFSLPPWFMLGLHAFTSVNVVRYNLILIPCLAIAVAYLITFLLSAMRNKGKFMNEIEPS